MAIRNVGLAVGIGVLVAAGSLVAAPVAKADIDFECKPGCWGAAAASSSTGQEVMRLNYHTRQEAEDAAVLWCDVLGKTNDCQVLTSGLGCLDRGQRRRENVRRGGRAISRRRRCGSLERSGARVDGRPPRLQHLTSLQEGRQPLKPRWMSLELPVSVTCGAPES